MQVPRNKTICTQRKLIMVALSDLVFYYSTVDLLVTHAVLSLRQSYLRVVMKYY
jgi:hypothetical protein